MIRRAEAGEIEPLLQLWERSVRASHTFMTDDDVLRFRPLVRSALRHLELWLLEVDGSLVGFIALSGSKIEALFLEPGHFRRGRGRRLVEHARSLKPRPLAVDVNEQNAEATSFYLALGFERRGRSPLDHAGQPYPLLHLVESEAAAIASG